jgi:lysine biosynthesis protein LysW
MISTPRTFTAFCPGCSTKIRFTEDVEVGQFVVCAECGDELEVVKISPVKLDWAFADSFDDFDDDDFGDDLDDNNDRDDDVFEDDDDFEEDV